MTSTQIEQSDPGGQSPERLWPLVREALSGSRRDLTAMPLARAIVLLAVPMVLEMVMESIFAIADIFWVSKLGADAVAAVGLTESLLTVVYAIGMGMAMGVGAVVARRTGAKDHEGASRAAAQAIFIGLGLAAVIGVVGGLFAPTLLAAMGASPAVMAVGARYARLMLAGDVSILLLFLINAGFRGAGDAAITMRALWLANGINILLGPLFVFGLGPFPRLGVTGAAVATTIGRSIGVLFLLRALARGKGRLVVRRAQLRIDRETMQTIFRLAKNGVVQTLIGFTSWIGLVKSLAAFGSVPLAGYTIAMRGGMFLIRPSWRRGAGACASSPPGSRFTPTGWSSRRRSTAPGTRGRRPPTTSAASGWARSRSRFCWRVASRSGRRGSMWRLPRHSLPWPSSPSRSSGAGAGRP